MLGVGESRRGMMFGLQSRQAGSRIFLGLQVSFGADDGGLRGIIFGRTAAGGSGSSRGHDGLASVAHFLHGRSHLAAEQTAKSNQNNNEPQHRVARH